MSDHPDVRPLVLVAGVGRIGKVDGGMDVQALLDDTAEAGWRGTVTRIAPGTFNNDAKTADSGIR